MKRKASLRKQDGRERRTKQIGLKLEPSLARAFEKLVPTSSTPGQFARKLVVDYVEAKRGTGQ